MLFVALSTIGITWGLPSRKIDKYLFGDGEPWSGEKIYRLAAAGEKFDAARLMSTGADVDVDPLDKHRDGPILLTGTEEDVAKIYLRYRLYTYQPDEMITMMALAGMRPGQFDFDPRLYQYGGLFIYPVGALIKLCGVLGLIDVRGDPVFFLDHPDEFGKFYIVSRAYSAAWGVVGVFVVFAIARHIGGSSQGGLLAALLFTLMPVVICVSHEGKPHLPGAVLMLLAVYFGLSFRQASTAHRVFVYLCLACGAAIGMVINAWPILILVPLITYGHVNDLARRHTSLAPVVLRWKHTVRLAALGIAAAIVVYLLTNPYVLFNALTNREILRSNFGNSLAMYEIAGVIPGLIRVLELTVEGATWPVVVLGVVALVIGLVRRNTLMLPLVVPALLFFLQFVLIGAGKPGEYGRFGILTNTALVIGTGCLLANRPVGRARIVSVVLAIGVVGWAGMHGYAYLAGFVADTSDQNSRMNLAEFCTHLRRDPETGEILVPLVTFAEPAPYCFPPIDFARASVSLEPITLYREPVDPLAIAPLEDPWSGESKRIAFGDFPTEVRARFSDHGGLVRLLESVDSGWRPSAGAADTPISWANKPFYDSIFGYLRDRDQVPLRR